MGTCRYAAVILLELNLLVTSGKHMMLLKLKEPGVLKSAVQGSSAVLSMLPGCGQNNWFLYMSPQMGALLGAWGQQCLGVQSDC